MDKAQPVDINAGIVDLQVQGVLKHHGGEMAERFGIGADTEKMRSLAFVYLCVQTVLEVAPELNGTDILDFITEGGEDFGVDAIACSIEQTEEINIYLFQAKYKRNLDGTNAFPENAVIKAIHAVRYLCDPASRLAVNPRLQAKIEDIHAYIRDGKIPRVTCFCCNNGLRWTAAAQAHIDREETFRDRVSFVHINHNELIRLLSPSKPIEATLAFNGKMLVEDFNYCRVAIGKVSVADIKHLVSEYGDRLLERNIRRYLGLVRVNAGIRKTLEDASQRQHFYFYNNGITLTCSKFDWNALQGQDYLVRVEGLQIINGGQTCRTILETLRTLDDLSPFAQTFVLVRLYQLPSENREELISHITFATNSQSPVDLRDLHSNDERQRQLETDIQLLGFTYLRQRVRKRFTPQDITSAVAAEAVLAVWRRRPQQAKFQSQEHFGGLYDQIFTDSLNGAQVVLAVLLYRKAETYRKASPADAPNFLPYAGAFIAMVMGSLLLRDMGCTVNELTHRNIEAAKALVEERGSDYLNAAVRSIDEALGKLYAQGARESLQQLAATFRRGDLLEYLSEDFIYAAIPL